VKAYRLNRLFHPRSQRCFDVAVDHGCFGESSFIAGIEDMPAAVAKLIAAAPDAIQLTVGQADLLQRHPGRDKPALVLRTDVSDIYGPNPPPEPMSVLIDDPVGHAVRLDAACVVVNLLDAPDRPHVRQDCVRNVTRLKAECERAAMPLMVEPLAFAPGAGGGYDTVGDPERIIGLARQATELGADVIKADPTTDVADYRDVVLAASRPVLVRGGGRVSDEEILRRTHGLLAAGAAGIVYGRNVIQHADPAGMVRALMAVVHEGATPEDALAGLRR
jgi:DhnA family fructose-bisphosphate aldolase class Ia